MRVMVNLSLRSVLELWPAGRAPNAELRVAELRAWQLGDDGEHVGPGERVDAGAAERRRFTRDDVLELHEVEEERIVAHAGEYGHAVTRGDDGSGRVADGDGCRLGTVDNTVRRADVGRRRGAAEMHHLMPAGSGHERLDHEIFDRVTPIATAPASSKLSTALRDMMGSSEKKKRA